MKLYFLFSPTKVGIKGIGRLFIVPIATQARTCAPNQSMQIMQNDIQKAVLFCKRKSAKWLIVKGKMAQIFSK